MPIGDDERDENTTSAGIMAAAQTPTAESSSIIVCEIHSDREAELYCTKCSMSVCYPCSLTKHKQHSVNDIRDVVLQRRQTLGRHVSTLDGLLGKYGLNIMALDDAAKASVGTYYVRVKTITLV